MEIPRERWEFVDARHVRLLGQGTPLEPLTIYELWYEATNSHVAGIGFAAVRDLMSFPAQRIRRRRLRRRSRGMRSRSAFRKPRRFLRHFLDLGMNRDLSGRRVFDGVLAHTGGAAKIFANHSFAEPNRTASQHEDRQYPEATFPFSTATTRDPFSGKTGALFRGDGSDPSLIQSNTSAEDAGQIGSLLTMDPLGQLYLPMPDSTRTYLIAGTQHAASAIDAPRGPNANRNNWRARCRRCAR